MVVDGMDFSPPPHLSYLTLHYIASHRAKRIDKESQSVFLSSPPFILFYKYIRIAAKSTHFHSIQA